LKQHLKQSLEEAAYRFPSSDDTAQSYPAFGIQGCSQQRLLWFLGVVVWDWKGGSNQSEPPVLHLHYHFLRAAALQNLPFLDLL